MLRFRISGSEDWGTGCAASVGAHIADGMSITVVKRCATLHITIRQHVDYEEMDLPIAAPQRFTLRCRQLQLCLWDDERRRLQGALSTSGEPTLGEEVLCASIDALHVSFNHAQSSAETLHYRVHVGAEGLQLDNYLASAGRPVILASVPSTDIRSSQRPFDLRLEVSRTAPSNSSSLRARHYAQTPCGRIVDT